MKAALQKFSAYQLVAAIIFVSAAITAIVHHFGNAGADQVAGAMLAGLAGLAVVAQGWLKSWIITIPANFVSTLSAVDAAVVVILGGGGIVLNYTGTWFPSLTPWVSLLLQGAALFVALFSQLFRAQTALRAARVAALAVCAH